MQRDKGSGQLPRVVSGQRQEMDAKRLWVGVGAPGLQDGWVDEQKAGTSWVEEARGMERWTLPPRAEAQAGSGVQERWD